MLKSTCIKIMGLGSIILGLLAFAAQFIAPPFILWDIQNLINTDYLLGPNDQTIWSQFPGTRGNDSITHSKTFQFFNITVARYAKLKSISTSLAIPLTLQFDITYDNISYSADGVTTSFDKNGQYYYIDPISNVKYNITEFYEKCTKGQPVATPELPISLKTEKLKKCDRGLLSSHKSMTKGRCGINYSNSFCSNRLKPYCSVLGKCVTKKVYNFELSTRQTENIKLNHIAMANESYHYPKECQTSKASNFLDITKNGMEKTPTNCNNHDHLYIYQVRPALSRAAKTIQERPPSDAFVLILYRLFLDVSSEILLNYFNAKIFYSESFNYNSFTANMTNLNISKQTQTSIWFDITYGWSKLDTFNNWIKIAYQPVVKKNLKGFITSYFNLTTDQVNSLVGTGSFLSNTIIELNTTISTKFSKICSKPVCDQTDLAQIQWANKGVTLDIDMPYIISSYSSINQSLIVPYEAAENNQHELSFQDGQKLLSYNTTDGSELNQTTTLLNFDNAKYLSDNLDSKSKIQTYFEQATLDEADILIKYYQNMISYINSYASNKISPETQYMKAKYARDGILESIDQLQLYVLNNVTMKAFNDYYNHHISEYSCSYYFGVQIQIYDKICQNPNLMPTNYTAITKWIEAWLEPDKNHPSVTTDAQKFIVDEISFTSIKNWDDLKNNYQGASFFKITIDNIRSQMNTQYQCYGSQGGCTRKYLAEIQYFSGNITDISSHPDALKEFPSLNVKSIAQWSINKETLKNKIPEIYGFANIHYNFTTQQFGLPMDMVYNYGKQSILNDQVIYLMSTFAQENRTADLAHQFSIWCEPIVLTTYFDHAFYEWYLGGFLKEQNIVDIVYGYKDSTQVKIANTKPLFGGQKDIDVNIQLNLASDFLIPVTQKTGRQPPKLEQGKFLDLPGQESSSLKNQYLMNRSQITSYDNSKYITHDGTDAWERPVVINGTDWYSTRPENYLENIDMYNHDFYQNQNYQLNATVDDYQFSQNKFKWNSNNYLADYDQYKNKINGTWNITRMQRLPITVTLPFYRDADYDLKPYIQNVMYGPDNVPIGNVTDERIFEESIINQDQEDMHPYFHTEIFSGFTFNYSLAFQVSYFI